MTINLQDKKVENLKIVHSSEQKQKYKADQRRCSAGVNNQKFAKCIGKDGTKYSNSLIDASKADASNDKLNNPGLTRNQGSNNQSKSYSNVKKKKHTHHLSSYTISNTQPNENNFPFSSKMVDKTKKHRRDMKSGDNFIRPNNFKYMNVEWINQNSNMNAMPAFYANQKINQNANQSNLMMFQQQLKLAMMHNSNIADTSGFISNQGAINYSNLTKNQSLLVFDKQSNSIIPIPNNFYSNMNKSGLSNKMAFTPANANTKNIMDVSPNSYVTSTFDKNMKQTPEKHGDKSKMPRYFQDKSAIKLNQDNLNDKAKPDTIPLKLEDCPISMNSINDT